MVAKHKTTRKPRYRADQKGAALALVLLLGALFALWWFGSDAPF